MRTSFLGLVLLLLGTNANAGIVTMNCSSVTSSYQVRFDDETHKIYANGIEYPVSKADRINGKVTVSGKTSERGVSYIAEFSPTYRLTFDPKGRDRQLNRCEASSPNESAFYGTWAENTAECPKGADSDLNPDVYVFEKGKRRHFEGECTITSVQNLTNGWRIDEICGGTDGSGSALNDIWRITKSDGGFRATIERKGKEGSPFSLSRCSK